MSENKNYVSNNEVHGAFHGDSKIKYLTTFQVLSLL